MPDDQYTDAQLSDGTTLRFQGQLNPDQVRGKVQDYKLKTGAGMGAGNTLDPATRPGGATNPIENARMPREEIGAHHNAEVVGQGNVPAGRAKIWNTGSKINEGLGIGLPMLGSAAMPLTTGATIPAAMRIATMGGLGAAGGRYAGGGLGGMFGPTGKQIGEGVGSVLGGLAGGLEGYKMQPPNPEEELGSFMNKGYKSMDIPPEEAERGAFMNRGYQSMDEPPARMPGLKIGHPEVNVVPEPRGEFAGENPNYMASVPRDELNRLAVAAKPGAGTQLQQLGKPVIYIPRGSSGSW